MLHMDIFWLHSCLRRRIPATISMGDLSIIGCDSSERLSMVFGVKSDLTTWSGSELATKMGFRAGTMLRSLQTLRQRLSVRVALTMSIFPVVIPISNLIGFLQVASPRMDTNCR